jgi:hypothetical protein
VTLKATVAVAVAALVAVSLWLLAAHVGHTEPRSQIDQIELGRR